MHCSCSCAVEMAHAWVWQFLLSTINGIRSIYFLNKLLPILLYKMNDVLNYCSRVLILIFLPFWANFILYSQQLIFFFNFFCVNHLKWWNYLKRNRMVLFISHWKRLLFSTFHTNVFKFFKSKWRDRGSSSSTP